MTLASDGARTVLPPYPSGWYAVAWSRDVAVGDIVPSLFCGSEVVVVRTADEVAVMAAHCPHLGASLALGGSVEGDSVRCPFHGFRFDTSGACVATGYGTRPPAGLEARTWEAIETDGAIYAWHDGQGAPPGWTIPDLDSSGYGALAHREFTLRDHPQETTENSVDLGHFAVVHGYRDVALTRKVEIDGPRLRVGYRARRPLRPLGRLGPAIETAFTYEIEIHGLGYSKVDVSIPAHGLQARLLVLATPRDGTTIDLRLGLRLREPHDRKGLLRLVPAALVRAVATSSILNGFAGDAAQDFPIWENKAYVPTPRLAAGDGPIGLYRRWAGQFYP